MVLLPRCPPIVDYLISPRARHANDRSAAAGANWRRFDDELPRGLSLTWLGTAGFRLSYEGVDLLIDPYVSRASLPTVARRKPLTPSAALIEQHVPRADAVLMGHTHFDHAIDAPLIARRSGCPVFGSRSLGRLMQLHGLADRAVEVEVYRVYEVGPFSVTFVPSRHSRLLLGLAVPYEGELTCDNLDHLTGSAYRCGQVYGIHIEVAGVTFYHQGSADLIDDAIRHGRVDYFLAGIAGRGFTERYWERILPRLSPRVIVPHHFDNFFLPLGAEMGFSLNVNFGSFLEEVRAVSGDFAVRSLDPLQRVGPSDPPEISGKG